MQYGYFDDLAREYVITNPRTPYPWINFLGNEDFFGLISNTAGGYSFYKDPRMLRITRYRYNNIPTDLGGRYFYITDGDRTWSPGWMPVRTELDHYECRHGLGYSVITGELAGIAAELTCLVPLGRSCEIYQLKLTNKSQEQHDLRLYSFLEFCLWDALDDMTNFQRNFSTGEVEIEGSTIYHKTEYRERRNHFAYFHVNRPVSGFDSERESFVGLYNGLEMPQVVARRQSAQSVASGWSPIASHQIDCSLAPGQSECFIFQLGYVENPEEEKWSAPNVINKTRAHALQQEFSSEEQVATAMLALADYWQNLLGCYQLQSPDDRLNRMVNIWHQYQCMVTFNLSRSASYFESGIGRGMGFRDSCQDLIGFVHLIPERARGRILDIAAIQFKDGSTYHQYQPLTKKGNMAIGGGFNDDPLWLIYGTAAYLRETGDYTILDEPVPFTDEPDGPAILMDHLACSFRHVPENMGPHGLPLIGRADWNDCLNLNCFSTTPGESFQTTGNYESGLAESVFIGGLFVLVGKDYVEILRRHDQAEKIPAALKELADMEQAVMKQGWDGEHFLRAYDAYGAKVGSNFCEEGQIFIEPQGMCVMAGLGIEDGRALQAMESVQARLDTEYGIMLQQPPYSRYYVNLGEISSYPPGYKENAGIFCHNNPWITIAEAMLGRGNRAFETYRKICPSYLEPISEIHRTEPYVYSQMVAGCDAVHHGEAKNAWLTGTAAWCFYAISQAILGIQPDYDGLVINPCIPDWMDRFTVTRRFRGATYQLTFDNPAGKEHGQPEITVDGKTLSGNRLPVFGDGLTHEVMVRLL